MNNLKERNIFFLISSIATLIFTVYVLYVTVFDQIISQNQGYFYAVVFGFILLLVYLLCNLFTKLVATSASVQNNMTWRIVSIVILVVMGAFFIYSRMKMFSSLDASESDIYRSAISMRDGLFSQSKDLVDACLNNPSHYIYAVILSVIFNIFEASSRTFLWANTIIYVLNGLFVYLVTLKLSDRLCGIFATALLLVMPSSTFATFAYTADPIFSLILLGTIYLYTELWISTNEEIESLNGKVIAELIFASILTGILLFVEPVLILLLVFLIISFFCMKKKSAFYCLITTTVALVIFAGLSFAKASSCDESFGTILEAQIGSFDFLYDTKSTNVETFSEAYGEFSYQLSEQNDNINDSYYFLTDSNGQAMYTDMKASWIVVGNQLIYMFLLIMLISCLLIALKDNYYNVILLNAAIISCILMIFFEQNRSVHKHSFISVLIVFCGVSLHYLYLNHHPEQKITLNALDALEKTGRSNDDSLSRTSTPQMDEGEFVRRAKALIFVGNDEDLYRQIKNEEHRNAMHAEGRVNPIENTFDDYDEDFFLDSEDENVKGSEPNKPANKAPMAPIASAPTYNKDTLPAWKQKPEKFGTDDMFFDEDDTEYENIKNTSAATSTIKKDEPHVEVVKRDSKNAVQPKNKTKEKSSAKKVQANQVDNIPTTGKAVRRIKTIGVDNNKLVATSGVKTITTNNEIPNPLPVPKKKEHKPIDYKVKENKSGWDYDYDVSDDDDWDF